MAIYPSIAKAVQPATSVAAQDLATTVASTGSWVDVSAMDGTILLTVDVAGPGSGNTVVITVNENETTSGSGTAVPADALFLPTDTSAAAATFTTVTNTTGALFQTRALKKDRVARYIKIILTPTGTATAIASSALVIGANKYA